MAKGLDTVSNVKKSVSVIKNKGYSFVIRYYSLSGNTKRTSADELQAIANAGLKRIVVYQNQHNAYSKFSASIADTDASDAIAQAKSVGQTSGAIYFAVDYDASASEIDGNIKKHFEVLSKKVSVAGYSLGVYGSSLTCKRLKDAKLVTYTWLAMGSGWGYGTEFNGWNIHQTKEVTLNKIKFDENEASSLTGIGAW